MYASYFRLLFGLLTAPRKAWDSLTAEKHFSNENYYRNFLYPSIGLIALCAFVGRLLRAGMFDVIGALQSVVCDAVAAFGGVFVAAWTIRFLAKQLFDISPSRELCEKFVGYASAAIFVAMMAGTLLTAWPAVRLIALLSAVTVVAGSQKYLGVAKKREMHFSAVAWLAIILSPTIILIMLRMII
jgi:hypothetical protein